MRKFQSGLKNKTTNTKLMTVEEHKRHDEKMISCLNEALDKYKREGNKKWIYKTSVKLQWYIEDFAELNKKSKK